MSTNTAYYHGPEQYQELEGRNGEKSKYSSYGSSSRFSERDIFEPYLEIDRKNHYEKEHERLKEQDSNMKFRIRVLRIISRVFSACLSIGIVVQQAIVVMKFLKTQNRTYPAGGRRVQAWPDNPITIYSYVYFAISALSMVLDLITVVAYCEDVNRSNKVDAINTVWSAFVFMGNVLIWAAAVSIYRYGKTKERSLWGYSCSSASHVLQPFIPDVNFRQLCGVQDSSFYIGVAEIASAILSTIIFVLMIRRTRTKKQLKTHVENKLLEVGSTFS